MTGMHPVTLLAIAASVAALVEQLFVEPRVTVTFAFIMSTRVTAPKCLDATVPPVACPKKPAVPPNTSPRPQPTYRPHTSARSRAYAQTRQLKKVGNMTEVSTTKTTVLTRATTDPATLLLFAPTPTHTRSVETTVTTVVKVHVRQSIQSTTAIMQLRTTVRVLVFRAQLMSLYPVEVASLQ